MDTRLLRTFATVARTENLTAAAERLHLVQSTVTAQVQALEKELDLRLFDRLPRGVVLTGAGREVLAHAEAVLEAESRLRAVAASTGCADGRATGRVMLSAGETLVSARLPGVVAALRRSHPGVEVDLRTMGTATAVAALRSGELDLALLLEDEAEFRDIECTPLAREPLVLVCSPEHPAARRATNSSTDWAELAREDYFLHEQGCSYSDRFIERLRAAAKDAPPRITRFGSLEAARSCVAAGLGLSLLARANVADALAAGRLTQVPGPQFPDVTVQLARHRRRWLSPAAAALTAELPHHLPR
ncbi:LysR family transcriptional regulator [Kitasatospora sp. GAS204B]|uniref:LysR family transcriptional regulator n=1 Tax=unclassified Kitasatospora TaxID=2633591 RepID=UPI0024759A94|nr:LysR family transcriptional regulator [Kitasatospora sp. GAS204B]MDH6116187.1 DNA-binding transcriptional LysR family regulator [Kitasatospora sp. GAS204B]